MTLVKAVDSYSAPSPQQLALAKADGVVAWNGYLPGKGIDSKWTSADFARIKDAGLHSIAYASGWADPQAMRGLANLWGVRGCLDVESSIRGDGTWVQPWLDDSGFGVYHEEFEYPGHAAPFHIMADYVASDPKASWPANIQRPAGPVGWQWKGNVVRYGGEVDLCWFDSEILGVPTPQPVDDPEDTMLVQFVAKTVPPPAGTGVDAVFISNGMRFRHVLNPNDETGVAATGVVFNGGKPVPMWASGEAVADVWAFGSPDNEHTATMLGLPFP